MTTFHGPASDSAVVYAPITGLLGHRLFYVEFCLLLIIADFSSCDTIDQHRVVKVVLPDEKAAVGVSYHVNIIWLQASVEPGGVRLIDYNISGLQSAFLRVVYSYFHGQSLWFSLAIGAGFVGEADNLLLRFMACFFRKLSAPASISMIMA